LPRQFLTNYNLFNIYNIFFLNLNQFALKKSLEVV